MGTSEIMDTVIDPYECLGVAPHASQAEIRKCYKKLVLTYHPDKTRDETEKSQNAKRFLEVQEAYEIIGDDKKRKEYDDEQIALAQIKEFERKEKENREKARRRAARRDEDARRREEERRAQAEADRMAEKVYQKSKKSETDQLAAALQAQRMRKMQTDAKRLAEEEEKKERVRRDREDRKRKDSEAKRMQDEELQRLKDLSLQEERMAQEKEKRHRVTTQEKRDRDRRQDRDSKTSKHCVPPYENFDDFVDSEPPLRANLERVYSDRGRPSRERLREPLTVPRDSSQRREGSRNRKERESREIPREPETLRNPERERVKREFYEGSPRRMSTEPLYEHLRTPPAGPFGSPPQQHPGYYSSHPGAGYSPPPSPRPRSSLQSMNSPQQFTTPQKGRDRTRDRPSVRKHAESYREPSYGSHDDDHPRVINRDSGDSGYSTGTQSTPLRNPDPKISSERLAPDSAARDTRKKEKGKKWIQVDASDDEASAEEFDPRDTRGSHRRSSRDDHSPRHGNSPPDADPVDPFIYMTSGAKSFSYTPDNVYPRLHTRHNSEHYAGTIPKINLEDGGYSPSYKPRHHTSREVPPAAGGYYGHAPPQIIRNQTWSGPQ